MSGSLCTVISKNTVNVKQTQTRFKFEVDCIITLSSLCDSDFDTTVRFHVDIPKISVVQC